ncbi:response regulator [Sphingorhabdus pulchriflava]|uniref:Response regulator n=1 Tax=Sphingorhabdus pulchriflava TaxID=2292257 RepID=A0A371BEU2_9SPHN|nr:response regulator [Sphingorhabdus pulchriflava]RDV06126.1 response regulator [Sphingorhabdus pulchriflava]
MNPLRILIAEDEAVIAVLLAEVLTDLGHDVCAIASTADETIAAAHQHQPDLMIVDPGLRDSSGVDAVLQATAERAVPHIFMTGDLARLKSEKPEAIIIQKPFDEADLIAAIDRVMA